MKARVILKEETLTEKMFTQNDQYTSLLLMMDVRGATSGLEVLCAIRRQNKQISSKNL